MEGVAGRLAHVSADGQRDLLDLHMVLVAARRAERRNTDYSRARLGGPI